MGHSNTFSESQRQALKRASMLLQEHFDGYVLVIHSDKPESVFIDSNTGLCASFGILTKALSMAEDHLVGSDTTGEEPGSGYINPDGKT